MFQNIETRTRARIQLRTNQEDDQWQILMNDEKKLIEISEELNMYVKKAFIRRKS